MTDWKMYWKNPHEKDGKNSRKDVVYIIKVYLILIMLFSKFGRCLYIEDDFRLDLNSEMNN